MKSAIALASFAAAATLIAADNRQAAVEKTSSRPTLTLAGARAVGLAAEAFAHEHHATPAIAVVDDAGVLLYFARLDGSFAAAASVSVGKARTSATFRKPTKVFEDSINSGRFTMTALPDFTPLQGGVPIVIQGEVIGAVGVSGALSAAQDEEVATAGVAALGDVSSR